MLRDREKKVLDALVNSDSVKTAAVILGMSERTVYNMLYRLRIKYGKARKFTNQMLGYRRKSYLLRKVLTPRMIIEEEEEEEELT